MTISDTATKFRYQGNGVTDTFAFSGKAFTAADLVVEIITRATDVLVETLTITTHYSVTIADDGTASITTVSGKIPSSTQDIQIRRALAQTQSVVLPTGTKFPAKSVENAIDRAVGLSQDLEEAVTRSLKFPATSSTTTALLPEPTANATILFDGTSGTFKVGPTSTQITSAEANATAAAASAAAAAASAALVPLSKYDATTNPTVNDDSGDGYSVGSVWINTTTRQVFTCEDATVGAAVWLSMRAGILFVDDFGAVGDGTTDDYQAIQDAIDYAQSIGGGRIFLGRKNYGIETSLYLPELVRLEGMGSRLTKVTWIAANMDNFTKGMVYNEEGTDMSPDLVFSSGIVGIDFRANGVADVCLAVRGIQENCIYSDLVLEGYLDAGLDILTFTALNRCATFSDLHIIPDDAATTSYGIRGEYVRKCIFRNITIDSAAGTYARGISLQRAVNNIFDCITTEDANYGFYITTSSANNTYRQLEAYRVSGGTTHFYTTETRYIIHGIRTRQGYTNHIEDGTNTIAAGTDTDSVLVERGANHFRRLADSETYTSTSTQFIRGAKQVAAGTSGNGQSIFRQNTTIAISGTKEVVIDVGAESRGFAGKLMLFSTGDQRYYTEVAFGGFVSTGGTVSGGEVSTQFASNATRVSIAAPAAVSGGATSQQFGIVITNASGTLTQVLEVKVEITVQSGQASSMTIV